MISIHTLCGSPAALSIKSSHSSNQEAIHTPNGTRQTNRLIREDYGPCLPKVTWTMFQKQANPPVAKGTALLP